jgi:DNA mismatch repair protein MutL
MAIRLLPSHLIDRIAAGEVVERPASVVKELVENSLDAGARSIRIAIREGGVGSILVEDDGAGMTPDALRLAIERHATSKLPGDDLLAIESFGFRGEALPAIAAVARFTLSSRPAGAESGWQVRLDAGAWAGEGPTPLGPGTRAEVADLFGRIPARRKFLKSERAELAAVAEVVRRLAMAHPDVGFRLESNGRALLAVAAETGPAPRQQRVLRLLPDPGDLVAVDIGRDDFALGGVVGLPSAARGQPNHQYLFVNGRPVKDRLLVAALRAAFADRLPRDRHAVAALFIAVPPDRVDVNVHPAKTEVRFLDAGRVRAGVISAVRDTLDAAGLRASPRATAMLATAFAAPGPRPAPARVAEPALDFALAPAGRTRGPDPADAATDTEVPGNDHPLGVARGQIANTYIVAEAADGLILVDQHAAHERLVLESLRSARAGLPPPTQPLLIAEPVDIEPAACAHIAEAAPELGALGLEVERFGDAAILVRSVPAALAGCDTAALVRDLADDLAETGGPQALTARLDRLAATFACHSSVRAGRALSHAEMNALLRRMEQVPQSATCNHGRPTFVKLDAQALARLFGRR